MKNTFFTSNSRLAMITRRVLLHRSFVTAVVIFGLMVRLVIAVALPLEYSSDSAWYLERAEGLAAGEGYLEEGIVTAYWPVGWPAILAGGYLLFRSLTVTVVVLNLVAAGLIMALVLLLGRRITKSELTARLSLLAYAVYPNHIAYAGSALTELVYTAIIVLAFAILIHVRNSGKKAIFIGLLFGIASLIKTQTIIFPLGVLIVMVVVYKDLHWKNAVRVGVLIYCIMLLVIIPWSLRNQSVFGEFVLVSSNGGAALLLGANDLATGDHFEYEDTEVFKQFGIPKEQRIARQVELDKLQKVAAIEWIKTNTSSYLALIPKKIFLLWHKDTDGFWAFEHSYSGATSIIRVTQIINQIYFIVLLALSLYCGWHAIEAIFSHYEPLAPLALLFCMPIFVTLLASVFTGQIRYHFPAMPFIIIAASWSIVNILLVDNRNIRNKWVADVKKGS